jgi:hypothetical protein
MFVSTLHSPLGVLPQGRSLVSITTSPAGRDEIHSEEVLAPGLALLGLRFQNIKDEEK